MSESKLVAMKQLSMITIAILLAIGCNNGHQESSKNMEMENFKQKINEWKADLKNDGEKSLEEVKSEYYNAKEKLAETSKEWSSEMQDQFETSTNNFEEFLDNAQEESKEMQKGIDQKLTKFEKEMARIDANNSRENEDAAEKIKDRFELWRLEIKDSYNELENNTKKRIDELQEKINEATDSKK